MKAKISRAQEEVWEWKERAFKGIESIPENERIKHIASKTKKTIEMIKRNKAERMV